MVGKPTVKKPSETPPPAPEAATPPAQAPAQ